MDWHFYTLIYTFYTSHGLLFVAVLIICDIAKI